MTFYPDPENENNGTAPEQPVEQPAEQPVEQPAEQPVEQPAEQPVEQPVEQPEYNPYGYDPFTGEPRNAPPVIVPVQPKPDNTPKKLSTGSKVFIAVVALVICAVIGLSAYSIASALNGQGGTPSPGTSTPASSPTSTPNAPNITLDDLIMREGSENLSVSEAYDKVATSVVLIKTYVLSSSSVYAEGTGMVISADGYILTCYHVVSDCNTVSVVLPDGRVFSAETVAYDASTDLAVLKIDVTGLTPVEFSSGNNTKVGQFVMAVGNPGGDQLASSMTFGILSGSQRVNSLDSYTTLLQIDAAVNPGNSGGPLINLSGQVIGIITSKIADVDYEGIGFAIPSDEFLPIVEELLNKGYVSGRVRMGVTIQEYTASVVEQNNLPGCVVVYSVVSGTDAERQGVKQNDIITAIDGVSVTSSEQLIGIIRSHKPGDTVKLSIYRQRAGMTENLTIPVTLYEDIGQN